MNQYKFFGEAMTTFVNRTAILFVKPSKKIITSIIIISILVGGIFGVGQSQIGIALLIAFLLIVSSIYLGTKHSLKNWQLGSIIMLYGFVTLTYGFTNFMVRVGFLIVPIGYFLLLLSTIGSIVDDDFKFSQLTKEPVIIIYFALLGITIIRLTIDVTLFGSLAIRDASFVLDGIAIIIGYQWGRDDKRSKQFLNILAIGLILQTIYMITFFWRGTVQSLSPISGVYREVSLFGSYFHGGVFLLSGLIFMILPETRKLITKNQIISVVIIGIQASLIFALQSRALYIAIIFVLLIFIFWGKSREILSLGSVGVLSVGVLLLLQLYSIQVEGRLDEISFSFLLSHLKSVTFAQDAAYVNSLDWRINIFQNNFQRLSGDPLLWLLGSGFGDALTKFNSFGGAVVRQPHNIHLTYLLRLGVGGLLLWWGILILSVKKILRAIRKSQNHIKKSILIWSLLFLSIAVEFSTFQTWLEFSHGGVPFFLILGFALGLSSQVICKRSAISNSACQLSDHF